MQAAEAAHSLDPPEAGWTADRLRALFASLAAHPRLLLAVSGGPDSTALLLLVHRWRAECDDAPPVHVATVDHGLRPEARAEAETVAQLAQRCGCPHATLPLATPLPARGSQEAARSARYDALSRHARAIGATALVLAHTADDQAETVLFRLMRGSGLAGLAGMASERGHGDLAVLRPLLGVPKAELIALCRQSGVSFAEDPSNSNDRFARARLRALMPALAAEGLDGGGLNRFAARMARAEAALDVAAEAAWMRIVLPSTVGVALARGPFALLPEELRLRVLSRAVAAQATEGVPELGKLEALLVWVDGARDGRRSLAGALVRVRAGRIEVHPAPPRRPKSARCVHPDANLHGAPALRHATHLGKDRART